MHNRQNQSQHDEPGEDAQQRGRTALKQHSPVGATAEAQPVVGGRPPWRIVDPHPAEAKEREQDTRGCIAEPVDQSRPHQTYKLLGQTSLQNPIQRLVEHGGCVPAFKCRAADSRTLEQPLLQVPLNSALQAIRTTYAVSGGQYSLCCLSRIHNGPPTWHLRQYTADRPWTRHSCISSQQPHSQP